jgi:hypothetical protein
VLEKAPFIVPLNQTPAVSASDRGVVAAAVSMVQLSLSHDGSMLIALDNTGSLHTFKAPSLEPQRSDSICFSPRVHPTRGHSQGACPHSLLPSL